MFRARVSIKENGTEGWKKFRKEMSKVKGSYVSVGLHNDAGSYEDGTSVVDVGLWSEFGTEHIPPRPWMRSVLQGKENEINQWRVELVRQLLDGKITVEKALATIGFRLQELFRNQINSNMPPPNAPSTTAFKIRDGVAPRTLVETTLMMRSVSFKVVVK